MSVLISDFEIYSDSAWYCARTQPKHEHIAAANVAKKLGFEVFHPRLRIERATRRGVVRLVEPLFPCYIFINCPVPQKLADVSHVSGIRGLVRFGGQAPVIADEVIDELKQCFEQDEPVSVQDRLQSGTEVSVVEGALMGSHGVVVRLMPARQRVQILLDFLGRTTLAEVDRNSLQVLNRSLADMVPALANTSRAAAHVGA